MANYEDAKEAAASGRYPPLFHGMLDRGVALAPGAYEIMFPGLAHGAAEIEQTAEAAARRSPVQPSGVPRLRHRKALVV